MKKFLFAAFFLSTFWVSAQTLSVGPRLGYSWGGMSRSEEGKIGVKGVLAGGVFNMMFNELFSLQLEAYYTQKGGGYGYILNGIDYKEYFGFRVVEFPLLAKFTIGKTRAKTTLMIGPYLGYITKATYYYQDEFDKIEEEQRNFTSYDQYGVKTNRLDIGFQLGGGMSVDIGKGKLLTDIRFGVGLTEWFKFEPGTSTLNTGLKNLNHRTWALTIGYIFPIWGDI